MNKADLINHLSTQLGGRRAATVAVEAMVDIVIREVAAGGSVGITGFGTFERADRAPRTGRNPRTGELVPIAGTSTPRFRPGTHFKEMVAAPELLPSEGMAGGRAPAGSAPRQTKAAAPKAKASASKAGASATKTAKSTKAKSTKAKTSKDKPAKAKTAKKASTTTSDDKKKGGKKKSDKKK